MSRPGTASCAETAKIFRNLHGAFRLYFHQL